LLKKAISITPSRTAMSRTQQIQSSI